MNIYTPLRSLLLCAALWFAGTPAAMAITVAPGSLGPGDQYRLAFVTFNNAAGRSNAVSADIADYNSFVTVNASYEPELLALGTSWTAIVSTGTVDARDNTNTNPASTGVPIYLLNGTRLADNNSDLWDDSLDNPLDINQFGTYDPGQVWSGSSSDGTQSSNTYMGIVSFTNSVAIGVAGDATERWVNAGAGSTSNQLRLYAISNTLTIPVTPVPIPGAVFLFGSGLLGLLGFARKK